MTTEDDFQRALDADPEDHHTRLVFADWLEERADPRAEGYRALGALGRSPVAIPTRGRHKPPAPPFQYVYGEAPKPRNLKPDYYVCVLPYLWFAMIPPANADDRNSPTWRYFASRREAEDAAASAFARLPPEHRAEVLAAPVQVTVDS